MERKSCVLYCSLLEQLGSTSDPCFTREMDSKNKMLHSFMKCISLVVGFSLGGYFLDYQKNLGNRKIILRHVIKTVIIALSEDI